MSTERIIDELPAELALSNVAPTLLKIATLPFVYLALGAWYLVAVPLAIAFVAVTAVLLALKPSH